LPLPKDGPYGFGLYGVGITVEELFDAVIGELGVDAGPVDNGTEPEPVGNGNMDLLPAGKGGVKLEPLGADGNDP